MARILLGVTGGIAAYKALELTRLATKAGHTVRVVQTEASTRFVGTASFAAITGAPVLISEWEADPLRGSFPGDPLPTHAPLSHLALVERAELFLIAPASANTIAKLAHGLADNLLTSAALATTCPLLVAPAMNNHMWANPATQANLATLRGRGITVLEPDAGRLASKGEWGAGRLPEPAALLAAIEALVPASDTASAPAPAGQRHLVGVHVLVTAGGTREPIDAVRYLGNRSSGRMGFALADEAAALGATVTVVVANVALARDPRVRYIEVQTAAELEIACTEQFADTDVLLMAAAVVDYRPAQASPGKLKKQPGEEELHLTLQRTPDILAGLAAARRPGQTLVGFAAEHGEEGVAHGRAKLARKGVDAVIVNDISRTDIGFDAQDNEVTILTSAGESHIPRASKADVARAVLDTVMGLRAADLPSNAGPTA
jgi:phosphopantothenoylcysteine decarboxylase/phosphopantothenate--cysteine ligase